MKHTNTIILLTGFAGTGKLTVGQAIVKQDPSFKLVHNHTWINPIFSLFPDHKAFLYNDEAWAKASIVCDAIFSTMSELCPPESNFVITNELIEGDEYPKLFYKKLSAVVEARKSKFVPVRLICDKAALVARVQVEERSNRLKTIDTERAKKLSDEHEVFHFKHPNEMTLDISNLPPVEAASRILHFCGQNN